MAKQGYIAANQYVSFLKQFPKFQRSAGNTENYGGGGDLGSAVSRNYRMSDADYDLDSGDAATKFGAADNHAEEMAERAAERNVQRREVNDITEKQIGFLRSLIAQRGTEMHESLDIENLSRYDASTLITELLARPFKVVQAPAATVARIANQPALPDVPEGRYAIEVGGIVKFYKYDRPTEGKWAGRSFLKAQGGDDLYRINNYSEIVRILTEIAKDVPGAMQRYGQELGACSICGRTLTDEDSRAYGIGPDCRAKMGA